MKILIVDDDMIICRGLKAIIEKNTTDYEVVGEASDGEEALNDIIRLKPDLLVTDIKMPVMDGLELIKNIKRLGLDIKIIVLSGFDEYKYVRETLKTGVMDYLLKPIENNDFLELLKRAKDEIAAEKKSREEYRELNEIVVHSLEVLQEKLIKDLKKADYSEIESYAKKLNNPDLLKPICFIFVSIKINNLYTLQKQDEKDAYRNILTEADKIISDMDYENRYGKPVYKAIDGDRFYMLFCADYVKLNEIENVVMSINECLLKNIDENNNFSITAGLSKVCDGIEETNNAYQQAELALEGKFYKGTNKVILYDSEECSYNSTTQDLAGSRLDELINAIELGQIVKTKRAAENIIQYLKGENITPARFKEILADIVRNILVLYPEFKYITENYSEKYNMLYMIEEIDTLTELTSYTVSTFCDIVEKMNLERSEKSKKTIEIVKEFVRNNYNKNIGLKSVADYVHLNPSYLSEFFKNETRKNFIDFLTEIRIKEAKKLLANSDLKVYEIGQRVGYEDITTFNRAFKKITGITPMEYKNLLK